MEVFKLMSMTLGSDFDVKAITPRYRIGAMTKDTMNRYTVFFYKRGDGSKYQIQYRVNGSGPWDRVKMYLYAGLDIREYLGTEASTQELENVLNASYDEAVRSRK